MPAFPGASPGLAGQAASRPPGSRGEGAEGAAFVRPMPHVEKKSLQSQNRKREVIRATLNGEESFVEALTWEEIGELFAE